MGAFEKIFRSNISIDLFAEIARWISNNYKDVLYIVDVKDTIGKYELIMYYKILAIHQNMLSDDYCYPEYGLISDGSPVFSKAKRF